MNPLNKTIGDSLMPLTITGNLTPTTVYAQSFSNNSIGILTGCENSNQVQSKAKGPANALAQSTSNASTEGAFVSNHASDSLVGLHTDVCDFNIIPTRDATVTADGNFQTAGAAQLSAQAGKTNLAGQLAIASQTNVPSLTQSSPPNDFPVNTNPFAVNLSGSATSSSTPTAAFLANRNKASQLLASLASQSSVARDHSIVQDGTVTYNQTGPIDPVTNTAPGSADFLVFSSIRNNQSGTIKTAGNSAVQINGSRAKSGNVQAGNNLALATQGLFSNSAFSAIGIG
jgi:hypothetical protein